MESDTQSRGFDAANSSVSNDPTGEAFGRYRIADIIGEGGMGIVYLAEQMEPIRRLVVLKTLRADKLSPESIARFETECRALGTLNHPNIVSGIDAGTTDDGLPYLVMELIKGIPITEYCDRYRLGFEERLRLVLDVCRGVQCVHDCGIVHRDIKPGNVLVTVHDEMAVPKIIDFGLARFMDAGFDPVLGPEVKRIVGTPAYMSPEQADMTALDIDKRTDIYSLGALLYQLLVGSPPLDEQSRSLAWRKRVCEEEPLPPSSQIARRRGEWKALSHSRSTRVGGLLSQLRHGLDRIVMKAMEKDRTRRYQTAAELRDGIERYLRNVLGCGPLGRWRRSLTTFLGNSAV